LKYTGLIGNAKNSINAAAFNQINTMTSSPEKEGLLERGGLFDKGRAQ